MNASLIITTYNWPSALKLVLESIRKQTYLPFEIVIADDGSRPNTAKVIEEAQQTFPCPIVHCWQEDDGFRLSQSRNNAILEAKGDYLIMIDGDMVLDKHFISDHLYHAEPGYFIQGWRVKLDQKGSKLLLKSGKQPNFFFSGIEDLHQRSYAINSRLLQKLAVGNKTSISGTKGCNMAFWRQDVLDINGFNQEFVGWGKEDNDFAQRMINNGKLRKRLRHGAVAYHLYHPESSRELSQHNAEILKRTKAAGLTWCGNGIESKHS
jgi:glycosyltransferase involved in cell wall biosynthesis